MNFANVKALAIPEGNVKQIADGQGVVLWRKSQPLQITSITNPAVGTSSITGDRSCQLERSSNNNAGTFNVFFKNYDVSKGAGIRLTGSIVFAYCYNGPSTVYSSVTFNEDNKKRVAQSNYNGETKSFNYTIYPSAGTGYFRVSVFDGTNSYSNTKVTVNLNLTAL